MREWYLLYTKPHREPLVHGQLEDRGLTTFFPYLQFERGYGRGVRVEAFFPNYLFVHVDLQDKEANGLTWLAGVRSLVNFDGYPVKIPAPVVETLQMRLRPYTDKVLDKVELLFKPGDAVTVINGPFSGLEGIFQQGLNGQERVQILLKLLGGWTRVDLDLQHIEPLHKHSLPYAMGTA